MKRLPRRATIFYSESDLSINRHRYLENLRYGYPHSTAHGGGNWQPADRECFLTQLEPCAEALGFDYFSYIVFSCYPASRPKMLIEGNFSANYLEDYRRQRVYLQDPVIERAHHSTLQFQWDESFITSGRRFGGIWQFGLCAGWSQSVKDCYGRLGILTFAGKALPEQTPQARAVNETFFLWLAQTAHKTLREALISVNDDAIKDVLTLREKTSYAGAAKGKRRKRSRC